MPGKDFLRSAARAPVRSAFARSFVKLQFVMTFLQSRPGIINGIDSAVFHIRAGIGSVMVWLAAISDALSRLFFPVDLSKNESLANGSS